MKWQSSAYLFSSEYFSAWLLAPSFLSPSLECGRRHKKVGGKISSPRKTHYFASCFLGCYHRNTLSDHYAESSFYLCLSLSVRMTCRRTWHGSITKSFRSRPHFLPSHRCIHSPSSLTFPFPPCPPVKINCYPFGRKKKKASIVFVYF